MTLGQRVAQKRKEQGLSQEALGDRLGVSRQSIYKWESDTALPEIEKLIALSRLFSVSVGWLLGVEEDAPADTASGGELTEAQLNMVEEIVDRYAAAQPKAKRSSWDKWSVRILFAMCGAMLGALLSISGNVKQLDARYDALQGNISQVQNSVDHQIGTITDRVEEILKSQNELTADYDTELVSVDPAGNKASFSFRAVPKTFQEGTTAWLNVENSGDPITFGPYTPAGQTFSGEVSVELTDSTSLSIAFEHDGVRQTQLLDTYEGLYSGSLPYVDVNDGMYASLAGPGIFTLADSTRYVWTQPYLLPSEGPQASAADIRVGLFLNQKLAVWAEPCEKPERFKGFEDCDFYRLPDLELTLKAGDQLSVAAVVTDEYGRVVVCPGMPYCIDAEEMELTRPQSSTADSDPSHWEFE